MVKKISKSFLDGLIHGIILVASLDLVFSVYTQGMFVEMFFLGIINIAICSAVSFLLYKTEKPLSLVALETVGIILTALVVSLLFFLRIHFRFTFFPIRQLNNGAGIFLVLIFGLYAFLFLAFRIVILIVAIMLKKTKKTGDGLRKSTGESTGDGLREPF